MDDDELERRVRAGLERRAARAEVDPRVVGRARADARRRRTTRLAVLGAAASVVAVVGVVGVVADRDDPTGPSVVASDAPASPLPSPLPSSGAGPGPTRLEYWQGAQVAVPAAWGYGNPTTCGDLPVGEPYVGRPIGVTDACSVPDLDQTPTAPYVWLGVDLPAGTVDLGDGWRRTTVEVAGVAVSVASDDPALRQGILDTAAPGELCDPTIASSPRPRYDNTFEGSGPFVGARLCAYRRSGEGEDYDLVYARPLDRRGFEGSVAAVDAAPAASACDDRSSPSYEVVVLTAGYEDPYGPAGEVRLDRDVVYDLGCGSVAVGAPRETAPTTHELTEATVPWAGPEFRRLLVGPPTAWAYGRFIGIQG